MNSRLSPLWPMALALLIGTSAWANGPLEKNNCDRLTNPTDAQLDACFERFGKSPYRLDLERRMGAEDRANREARDRVLNERSLLESKTFNRDELDDEFFGQKVIIVRVDNRDADRHHELFDANRVCKYLGYTQAANVVVGDMRAEIWSDNAAAEGGVTLERDLTFKPYSSSFFRGRHLVKPLERITCFRTRDGSTEPLRHVPQRLISVMSSVNRAPRDEDRGIDNGPRVRGDSNEFNEFTSGITNPNTGRTR
jgi:hypothetical protein